MVADTKNEQFKLSDLRIDQKARARHGSVFATVLIVLALLAIVSAAAWYFAFRDPPIIITSAISTQSEPGQSVVVLTASGYVTPRQRATIASRITGRITALYVEEGLYVKSGQLLAELDDSDAVIYRRSAEADLQVAQASLPELRVQLADAERNLDRDRSLQEKNFISRQEFESSQTVVDSLKARIVMADKQVLAARARVDQAIRSLEDYKITAPFAGVVVSKDAQVGEMVSPVSGGGGFTRTGIATVVDMDSLEIEVDVNESYIARVTPGQAVEAILDAWQTWKIPARVVTVIPTADRQKATVRVRIAFDELDPRILPDMGVKVSFLNPEQPRESGGAPDETERRVLIPQEAVLRRDGKTWVFIVRNDRVEARADRLGNTRGNEVEVVAGLLAGDEVATGDVSALKDNAKVRKQTNE